MISPDLRPPESLTGPDLADWAEAIAFIEQLPQLSRANLRNRLQNVIYDDEELEEALSLLANQVTWRSSVGGAVYPFTQESGSLYKVHSIKPTIYEFLLWLSISPMFRDQKRQAETQNGFNEITRLALVGYLGGNAEAVQLAFSLTSDDVKGFREAVVWLARQLGLNPLTPPNQYMKDGGVDVVAWRRFSDFRDGYLVILCQCTVQKEWRSKTSDVKPNRWKGWIDFGTLPLTAISIPFVLPTDSVHWSNVRRDVDLFLDRFRLCELLPSANVPIPDEVETWCENERLMLTLESNEFLL